MPKSKTSREPKPLYRRKPPKPPGGCLAHATPLARTRFELREDGTIAAEPRDEKRAPVLTYSDPARHLWLYQGNCFELLDAIAAKYPEGRFDCIFADPPYFLSNGGITCHAGRMVRVDKGDWDKSQGADENHNFNREWLARCQRVLKPNGTIWVTGTHHVIFSIGLAMQQLGFKILNDIAGLIKVTAYLLDRQLERLERNFLNQGGLRERMTRARLAERAKRDPG